MKHISRYRNSHISPLSSRLNRQNGHWGAKNLLACFISAFSVILISSCGPNLLKLANEGRGQLKNINQSLAWLDTTVTAKIEEPARDMFGQPIANDTKPPTATNKIIEWANPSEVIVLFQSSHDEIDTSPGAQSLSRTMRSKGMPGISFSIGGSSPTGGIPVNGGMKQKILDQISIILTGSDQRLNWNSENLKKIISSAETMKATFKNAVQALSGSGSDIGVELINSCEKGVSAADQILEAAKQVLAAQELSASNVKPDESEIRAAVDKMLTARGEIRNAITDLNETLKKLPSSG